MNDLKPCPFCGGEYAQVRYMGGKWQEPSAFDSGYRGECCECGAITAAYDTEAEAIAAWNTRAERTCRETTIDKFFNGCDSCGYMWQFFYSIGKRERPNYCPNCGCKVVGE